jgi:hypothetical protein
MEPALELSTIADRRELNVNAWNHLVEHKEEIAWAAVFALIFAFLFELINPNSHLRTKIRHLQNRWAEHSNRLLARRIAQLEEYKKHLSDARWHYLVAFQQLFICLFCASLSALSWMVSDLRVVRAHQGLEDRVVLNALGFIVVAAASAVGGLRHVLHDSPQKIQALIFKIGQEIEGLQEKLRKRSSPS